MPGKKEYDAAITAVKNGVADDEQQALATKMAENAGSSATGSLGQAARDAFKGK